MIDTLSKVLGQPLDHSPYIALFGTVPPEMSLNNIKGNVLAFCTLLARRLILFKWKEPLPPTYSQRQSGTLFEVLSLNSIKPGNLFCH